MRRDEFPDSFTTHTLTGDWSTVTMQLREWLLNKNGIVTLGIWAILLYVAYSAGHSIGWDEGYEDGRFYIEEDYAADPDPDAPRTLPVIDWRPPDYNT